MVDIIITCLASNACSYQSIQRIDFFMSVQNLPLVGNSFVVASLLVLEKFFFSFNPKFYQLFHQCLCGAERSGKPGPFHIKPKAHAEKKETSEDE